MLLVIMLSGSVVSAYLLYIQQQRLLALTSQPHLVPFVKKGYVRAMRANHLVPGDVVVMQPGQVVCDVVLLRGHALAEESRLTGEVVNIFWACQ